MIGLAVIAGASAGQTLLAAGLDDFPPSKQPGVTYAKDIQPIFQKTCFRCHGADKQSAKLRLDSLEAVIKGGKDGPVIVVGKSATSDLVLNIAQIGDTPMPPKPKPPARPATTNGASAPGRVGSQPMISPPLTKEQVGLVRAWIDQGAK
jgi:mono/diheme cytochrome c family protein